MAEEREIMISGDGVPPSRHELLSMVKKHSKFLVEATTDEHDASDVEMDAGFWHEVLNLYFIRGRASKGREDDDLIFFVRNMSLHGYGFNDNMECSPFFVRRWASELRKVVGENFKDVDWRRSFFLNLIAHTSFTVTVAICSGSNSQSFSTDTAKLARIAVNNGLHHHLRHKAPLLEDQIQCFTKSTMEYPIHSNGLLDPPKALADIVESLLGAIFKDSNDSLETVWEVFKRLAEPLITLETLGKHPVSELHELCQKRRMQLRFLKDTWMTNTTVEVFIDDNLVGSATYGQKKEIALNRAAKAALDRLKEELP